MGDARLTLSILGVDAAIECADRAARTLVQAVFDGLAATGGADRAGTPTYVISRHQAAAGYALCRDGRVIGEAFDEAELIWLLDGDLVVEVQRRRPDLYFVHAATLERNGRAFLIVGDSGAGKSLTAWAMLHEGFGYLSDEIAPLDVASLTVHPYPRALSLKKEEPCVPPVPAPARRTGGSIHIPVSDLPGPLRRDPLPVGGLFFLRHDPQAAAPSARPMTSGEAAAWLYPSALNALAHPASGLDAAISIVERCPCFAVVSAELLATAALLRQTVEQTVARPRT